MRRGLKGFIAAPPVAGGFSHQGGERPMSACIGNWVTVIEGKRTAK